MSDNQNEQVYRTVIEEAFNKGNLAVLDQVTAASFVEHQAGIEPPSVAGVKRFIEALRSAFPDLRVTVDDFQNNGNKTWARLTARGTQQGPFAGLPSTGKSFAITIFDQCLFEGGKIAEHWGVADQMALLSQIREESTVTLMADRPAPTPPVNWI
jgi:predicted ester cyclase